MDKIGIKFKICDIDVSVAKILDKFVMDGYRYSFTVTSNSYYLFEVWNSGQLVERLELPDNWFANKTKDRCVDIISQWLITGIANDLKRTHEFAMQCECPHVLPELMFGDLELPEPPESRHAGKLTPKFYFYSDVGPENFQFEWSSK